MHTDVRQLIRLVCPSDDLTGVGPDALVTSARSRDNLIASATSAVGLTWEPDTLRALRLHAYGVPVYVAPLREDEDTVGTEPAYQGAPVSWDATSFFALRLGGPTGIRLRYVQRDGQDAHGLSTVTRTSGTTGQETSVAIYGDYALYIPEHQAAARLWGVDISLEP